MADFHYDFRNAPGDHVLVRVSNARWPPNLGRSRRSARRCCSAVGGECSSVTEMTQTLRAGLYWRQSISDLDGMDRQRSHTRAQAKLRGYKVVKTYEDNATSASKSRATSDWAKMLEDATEVKGENGRVTRPRLIDVVIAVDMDRLLRSIGDLGDLMKTGVKVLTVDGEIDLTSADGEFRASMLAAIARFEVRRKSERQKRANEGRASKGQRVGGRRPFGYEADGVTVRQNEKDAIVKGYTMLAHEEQGLGDIARYWNAEGLSTGQNKRLTTEEKLAGKKPVPSAWTRSGVRQVMLNRRNIGRLVYLGEEQAAPAEWPPLVGDEVFEAVHAKLTDTGRRTLGAVPIHLLTGIALCGVCGGAVHSGAARRKGSQAEKAGLAEGATKTFIGHRTYRCKDSMGHFARIADPVDAYIHRTIIVRLAKPDSVNLLRPTTGVDARKLRKEERRLREKMDALAVAYAEDDGDPILSMSQMRLATKSLQKKIQTVQEQLADAGRVDMLGGLVGLGGTTAIERQTAVQEVWAALPVARQRVVVRELLGITLYPTGRGIRTFKKESVGIKLLDA